MRNIQRQSDFEDVVNRITTISTSHSAQWGVMSIEEMLQHCSTQLRLAIGEMSSTTQGPWLMRTRLGKWVSLSRIPWPRSLLTPQEMNTQKNLHTADSLEAEKNKLVDYLVQVKNTKDLHPHPFFGHLTPQEWGRLIYKHLDHHLKQFGV